MANPYTKLPGYKYLANEYPNGPFRVFDRSGLGEKWYLEDPQHKWLVKKMPDGPTETTCTYDEAKLKANVSSRSVHSWEHWWKK
jgi:hypothetical protein